MFSARDHFVFCNTALTCSPSNPIIFGIDGPHISMSRRATWGTRRHESTDITEYTSLLIHTVRRGTGLEEKEGGEKTERNWVKCGPSGISRGRVTTFILAVPPGPKTPKENLAKYINTLHPQVWPSSRVILWTWVSGHLAIPGLALFTWPLPCTWGVGIAISALQKRSLGFRGAQ